MSSEIDNKQENEVSQEVIEVSWEDAEKTMQFRNALVDAKNQLSQFLLDHERTKRMMFTRLESIESEMYQSAVNLQEQYSTNPDWTYELKLPQQEGEKAYFVRKAE